jgi:hypothetical protein
MSLPMLTPMITCAETIPRYSPTFRPSMLGPVMRIMRASPLVVGWSGCPADDS